MSFGHINKKLLPAVVWNRGWVSFTTPEAKAFQGSALSKAQWNPSASRSLTRCCRSELWAERVVRLCWSRPGWTWKSKGSWRGRGSSVATSMAMRAWKKQQPKRHTSAPPQSTFRFHTTAQQRLMCNFCGFCISVFACFWDRVSRSPGPTQTRPVAEDGLELLILLPPPEC